MGRDATTDRLTPVLATYAGDLSRLLPEIAPHLSQSQAVASARSLGPQGEKHRLINTPTALFAQLATAQPLLIVLEDLHWSDDLSLELFLSIARRAPGQRILLIETHRSDEMSPGLLHTLADLYRGRLALEVQLARLSFVEVDTMLQAIFDLHRPMQLDFLNKIYELTEGNPFYVEAILEALRSSGIIVYADFDRDRNSLSGSLVPRTVQDAVRRRSHGLSADARKMLAVASVIGTRFSFDLLLDVLELDEKHLLNLIKECFEAQLVVEASDDLFAFRHALTRQAIYTELLTRERKALHGQIAHALERRYLQASEGSRRTRPTEIRTAELARHYYEAGTWHKAKDFARTAAAEALYAPGAAVACYGMVLESTMQLGNSPQPDLYTARGRAYNILGNFDAALSDHREALRLACETNRTDTPGSSHNEWEALIDLATLWATRDYRETERYLDHALSLARRMSEPSTLAHTLNRIGNWWMNTNEPDKAWQYHEEALSIFQASDEKRSVAATLGLLGSAAGFSDDHVRGTHYLLQAIELYCGLNDQLAPVPHLASLALCVPFLHTNLAASGDRTIQDSIHNGEEALQIARKAGWRSAEAFACFTLGVCYGEIGSCDQALTYAQAALGIAREIGHTQWAVAAHDGLGVLYSSIMAFPQARLHLEEARSLAHEIGSNHWLFKSTADLARTLIACGDVSQAEVVLDELLKPDTPYKSVGQRICWSTKAELALARSQPQLALAIVDRLLAATPNLSNGFPPLRLLKIQAEALILLRKAPDAESILLQAEAIAKSHRVRPLLFHINLLPGNLYRTQGKRNAAAQHYAISRSIAEELARSLQDGTLRESFLKGVAALLPRPRPISAARASKEASAGLTSIGPDRGDRLVGSLRYVCK